MTAALLQKVKIVSNSAEHVFECAPGQSLLAAMMAAQCSEIQIGCRRGGCGACRIYIRTGSYRHEPMSKTVLPANDRQAGYALACRIYPETPMIVEAAPLMREAAA